MNRFLSILLLLITFTANAQLYDGSIMIAGGGTENYGEWSDTPYGWVVSQAENGKIAIITYDDSPSSWLPNYFESLGAEEATNFSVGSRQQADEQSLYDALITFDGVFFKGGDQYNYYDYYKDTKLQQAVEEIYERGGVLSGTSAGLAILSGVFFSAENGTVYSHEALQNPNNQYMTLEDDFLEVFPGFIFDSHFAERARFGRLAGFMGQWKLNHGEDITGIGVDDKTAFCISKEGIGRAYGTGAVRIYRAGEENNFRLNNGHLLADNLVATQLLHNDAIQMEDFTPAGLPDDISPEVGGESFTGMLLAGSERGVSSNGLLLEALLDQADSEDSVLIVSTSSSEADSYQSALSQDGFNRTEILNLSVVSGDDDAWADRVRAFKKFLFVGNEDAVLVAFMTETSLGESLIAQMQQGISAFAGDDAHLVGKTYCSNVQQTYASYDGELEFEPGLALLETTVIMPQTFTSSDFWENTMTALPYAMNLSRLRFGIWLGEGNVMKYYREGEQSYVTSMGNFPMTMLINNGTQGGFSTQSAVSSGEPRNVAGFANMRFRLMDESTSQPIGSLNAIEEPEAMNGLKIFPNPAKEVIYVQGVDEASELILSAMDGTEVLRQKISESIDVSHLPAGIYFLTVIHSDYRVSGKVIIQ